MERRHIVFGVIILFIILVIVENLTAAEIIVTPDEAAQIQKKLVGKDNEGKELYQPLDVPRDRQNKYFEIVRDSGEVLNIHVSPSDVTSIKMCFNAGVVVQLDAEFNDTFQGPHIDDAIFFKAKTYENNRAVYVSLANPLEKGRKVETFLWLPRASNDDTFIFRIMGVPCEDIINGYPKKIIIQQKGPVITRDNRVLPPEDTIIEKTNGYARIQKHKLIINDMIMGSSSNWAVMTLSVILEEQKDLFNYTIKFLDRFQITEVQSVVEYLPKSSEKMSQAINKKVARFAIKVNIDKRYVQEYRFLHLILMDNDEKFYQYAQIDTLGFFENLKELNFDL